MPVPLYRRPLLGVCFRGNYSLGGGAEASPIGVQELLPAALGIAPRPATCKACFACTQLLPWPRESFWELFCISDHKLSLLHSTRCLKDRLELECGRGAKGLGSRVGALTTGPLQPGEALLNVFLDCIYYDHSLFVLHGF